MIDGLKLTLSGDELRRLLDERIADHGRCAERWRREREHEEQKHLWRAEVLAFIRDHIQPRETYRVGASDLEFGELFPGRHSWATSRDCDTADVYKMSQVEVENGAEIIRIDRR